MVSIEIKKYVSRIKRDGYIILPNILKKEDCTKIVEKTKKLYQKKKNNSRHFSNNGQETIRELVLRDPKTYLNLIDIPEIMKILENIFHDTFILDNSMASNSCKVDNSYKSIKHIDSHLAVKNFSLTLDVVVMICCNDFSKSNGSTIVWKGSQNSGIRIQNSQYKLKKYNYKKIHLKANAGSAIICLGHIWHQIGKNVNGQDRWAILNHYKRWWIKPATDFTRCGQRIFKLLNNKQKELFGFNSKSPTFNLIKKTRRYYTLSKIEKIPKNYKEINNY
jgi:ectoine hydroxylase-related dioxygenase (phytanoyl-CoA dioxygenase family)